MAKNKELYNDLRHQTHVHSSSSIRKMENYAPMVDYHPLNEITKKNMAPIPLIPELVDKLLGAQFFMKLDIQ